MRMRAGWRLICGPNFGSRGSKGSSVEVKVSVDGGVDGKAWVCAGRAEQVERALIRG